MPLKCLSPPVNFYCPLQGGVSFVDVFCYLFLTFYFIILSFMFFANLFHLLERAEILSLLCVMFPCVFVTFAYGEHWR